jgi:hypothetical protein
MRNVFFSLFTFIIITTVLLVSGCKKESAPSPPEQDLKISTDAASFTTTPGPDFIFNLKVESVMPIGGVQIEYNVKGESDNQNYPQGPIINTYSNNTRINISNLPRQKICICTVTVTSKTKSTNIATISFKVGYK